MNQHGIKVGSMIKFSDDRLWFTAQAVSENFVVCTSKSAKYHTIMDLKRGIRGDDNMVFNSGYDDKELCEQRLSEFESGDLEISHRNNVSISIISIK